CSASHAATSSSSPVKVPKRRSSFSSLPCSRIITHAEMLLLCTSSALHRECNTPYTPSFWTPPVAAARKGSSPTCSLVAESHNSLCLCAAGCKLYRGFENPVTLRSRPATPTPIFIPCCGLEKAMCNSIRSDPAVKIPPLLNNHSPGHSRYSHSAFRSLSK